MLFRSRKATLAYLCGTDDNGRWAVRVPGTCTTVALALTAITPAPVRAAHAKGKRVLRQGDLYVVEARTDDFDALQVTRHVWDREHRVVRHLDPDRPHSDLPVPFKAKAYLQSVLRMGRLGSRRTRFGD